jgi:hypothetical protein
MLCGKTDRLATPKDYLYLKKLLIISGMSVVKKII